MTKPNGSSMHRSTSSRKGITGSTPPGVGSRGRSASRPAWTRGRRGNTRAISSRRRPTTTRATPTSFPALTPPTAWRISVSTSIRGEGISIFIRWRAGTPRGNGGRAGPRGSRVAPSPTRWPRGSGIISTGGNGISRRWAANPALSEPVISGASSTAQNSNATFPFHPTTRIPGGRPPPTTWTG